MSLEEVKDIIAKKTPKKKNQKSKKRKRRQKENPQKNSYKKEIKNEFDFFVPVSTNLVDELKT